MIVPWMLVLLMFTWDLLRSTVPKEMRVGFNKSKRPLAARRASALPAPGPPTPGSGEPQRPIARGPITSVPPQLQRAKSVPLRRRPMLRSPPPRRR